MSQPLGSLPPQPVDVSSSSHSTRPPKDQGERTRGGTGSGSAREGPSAQSVTCTIKQQTAPRSWLGDAIMDSGLKEQSETAAMRSPSSTRKKDAKAGRGSRKHGRVSSGTTAVSKRQELQLPALKNVLYVTFLLFQGRLIPKHEHEL